ncbi:Rhomboid family protein [Roseivivax sp. THAF40]|uniref:rhomboid family intramembrane serine protease n=1 Tax=unclassified Roseivivax TaxID=2639302 RepID=UPI0012679203|nr:MULTISPECIES: rhomboid family intramembrane serine protease [unclassified Roseivivax]QFS81887.1 Rhomboid family protein [Roseivivax sp. THAF197b]QFT45687.1 Rhomboid family protein [Roseivivax sp. THAF40]
MSGTDHNVSPFNAIPPVTSALVIVMFAVEAILSLGARGLMGGPGAVGWRIQAVEQYAFSGDILAWMVETRVFPPEHMMRFLTYPFVHGNFTSALFACVMLLALGKIVAEALGPVRMLAVFVTSAIAGAVVFGLFAGRVPLVGAFPPIYGLIGAFTYLLWLRLGQMGEAQIRAFSLIGVLLGLQLVFGLLFGGGPYWIAEIAGFVAGFALSIVLVPGGFTRLMERLRER